MGRHTQGQESAQTKPKLNPHFAFQLRSMLRRMVMTPQDLVDEVRRRGLYVELKDVTRWLKGQPYPRWDRLLLILEDTFGVAPADWLSPIDKRGLSFLSSTSLWGNQVVNADWGRRLTAAMDKRDVSARELSQWFQLAGLRYPPSTIQSWKKGTLPRDGIFILPWLSKILNVPLKSLVPTSTGSSET